MEKPQVVIASATRTPIGAFQGVLSPVTAPQLGTAAIVGAITRAGIDPADVQEVLMGCVLPAGLGQAPARQAALGASIPKSVPATTINKMCGSGMKAIMMAADQIRTGDVSVAVAGGLESMTNAPYLLPKARGGMRMGHGEVLDHMFYDGLQSPFDGQLMGVFAENTAQKYGFTRADQDAFALRSQQRAGKAIASGYFADEIVAVEVIGGKAGPTRVDKDEHPRPETTIEQLAKLKTPFRNPGTVTAGNASGVNDGAAAMIVASEAAVKAHGLKPRARILGMASAAVPPRIMGIGPVPATQKLMARLQHKIGNYDLIELNEAFASQSLACLRQLGLPDDAAHVNPHGGAIALGHPLGMSGARLALTAVHGLETNGGKLALATMCVGVGQGVSLALERVS